MDPGGFQRPRLSSVYESFHDFLLMLHFILEPLLTTSAYLIHQGCFWGGSLREWFKIHFARHDQQVVSRRMKSQDLRTGRLLGQGCSGIIYETTVRGKNMAIFARKAFPAVPADEFEIEAARLVELDHPNIVKTLGWTVNKRSCSLVMEYMRCDLFSVVQKRKEENLRKLAASGDLLTLNTSVNAPFQLREAVNILSQIAAGMMYVHGKRLAHGDLKPNNVLVDSGKSGSMLVKVVDFGLINTKRRSSTLVSNRTRCSEIVTWKAPELFEDYFGVKDTWTEMFPDLEDAKMPNASDVPAMQRADIYSFALTCLYILGGQSWYSNQNLFELRKSFSSGSRPVLPSECPETLASLISSCWVADPTCRPTFLEIFKQLLSVKMELVQSKEQYEDLRSVLRGLKPWMKAIADQCQADSALKKCLNALEKYIHKGDEILKMCESDSSSIGDGINIVNYGPGVTISTLLSLIRELVKEANQLAGMGPDLINADLINASLGAAFGGVVGPLVERVIEGLKFVYHCKKQCTALREDLEMIKPLLEKISDQCQADSAMKNWLDSFEKYFKHADKISKMCKGDRIWDRAYEVKYGDEILKLREQIRENISLPSMALLTLQSGTTSKSQAGTCGMLQQVPLKILGMENHFKRVKSSIIEGHTSESSSCVAIQGMGGAGKTLLAQMVNNNKEIHDVFGRESILWITVGRDASLLNIYVRMGKHLKVDINSESPLEDQRTHLMNEFGSRRILLILDDVWDNVCIEYREMVEWLNIATGPGSVTVLTTREESIARRINPIMEVILLLSEDQSWELFCAHAFGTDTPTIGQELEALARDVCKECKCLPLALKVVGLAMRGKGAIAEWRRTLQQLQDSSIVNKSVGEQLFKRLHISYDQLDEPTKICFLYFAAFPEDYEICVEELCQIWVAESLFGEGLNEKQALDEAQCALNELRGRSLIDDCGSNGNGNYPCVKMHDILRDLAIHLTRRGEDCERESLFKLETKNLEKFSASWLRLPLKVKRMALWGKNIKRFPSNFRAPHLKVCMLRPHASEYWSSGNDIQVFSECSIEDKFFNDLEDLKYLQIGANKSLKTLPTTIGELESLKHLDLSYCYALKKLPQSIGGLGFLQHLNLSNCYALKELPESIGGSGSLQHLNLSECSALEELPQSMRGLGSLQHLNLSECSALEELPQSIGGLGSLQQLNLSKCSALEELPESIGGLGSLQHLNLSKCSALEELPQSIGGLESLQQLNLSKCSALEELPQSIGGLGSLQHLNLEWCCALEELPQSIGGLGSLEHIILNYCYALKELPENIGELRSVQHLNLEYCKALKELPESIGGLGSLQHLNLSECSALEELPESIGGLGSLQHLNLSKCSALEELPQSIRGLGSLQHLNLSKCSVLEELPESIGGLGSLQHLNLSKCSALEKLPQSIGGLGSLQHLNLSKCSALEELPQSIGRLGLLEHLDLSYCYALKELPESIGGFGSLQHLNLVRCDALKELPESIGGLGSLQHLNLSECSALEELPQSIGGLGSLQHLNLSKCSALEKLPQSIGGLGSLQHLNLEWCCALEELLESIGGLGSLQHLNLGNCSAVKELPESIGGLESLQHLNLKGCDALKVLPEFPMIPGLQILY